MTLELKDLAAAVLAPLLPAAALAAAYTLPLPLALPGLQVILPAMLGALALIRFIFMPPAHSRQRASNAVAAERSTSPERFADGRAPRRVGVRGAAPHQAPGRAPVDRLTPHYCPGRATVHTALERSA